MEYDYEISYKKKSENRTADILFRVVEEGEGQILVLFTIQNKELGSKIV